jgi:hypothetical protein
MVSFSDGPTAGLFNAAMQETGLLLLSVKVLMVKVEVYYGPETWKRPCK